MKVSGACVRKHPLECRNRQFDTKACAHACILGGNVSAAVMRGEPLRLISDAHKSGDKQKLKQTQKASFFAVGKHGAAQGMTLVDWLILPACTSMRTAHSCLL